MDSPCYCDLLRTAARKTTAIYDHHLATVGLTLAQYHLIKIIHRASALSITELAAAAELDRSTVGRNVQVLEKHGLVETCNCSDQRRSMLKLTAEGRERFTAAAEPWNAAQAEIEAALGAERVAAITGLSGAF